MKKAVHTSWQVLMAKLYILLTLFQQALCHVRYCHGDKSHPCLVGICVIRSQFLIWKYSEKWSCSRPWAIPTMNQVYKIGLESSTWFQIIIGNQIRIYISKCKIGKVRNFGHLSEQTDNSQHSRAFDT